MCSGRGRAVGEVLSGLLALTPLAVEVVQLPHRQRPADIPALVGDPSRLRRAVGWQAEDTWEYWRGHLAGSSGPPPDRPPPRAVYTGPVHGPTVGGPLVWWEGATLGVDLEQLHAWANRHLPARVKELRRLGLRGVGDGTLELEVAFRWKGVVASAAVRVQELKLLHRFLGCRVQGVKGPLGVPLPAGTLAAVLGRALPGKVRWEPGDGVLLVDLREWLPAWLDLSVREVRCLPRAVQLVLGPGSLGPLLLALPGAAR